jgi:hypothetical protein
LAFPPLGGPAHGADRGCCIAAKRLIRSRSIFRQFPKVLPILSPLLAVDTRAVVADD